MFLRALSGLFFYLLGVFAMADAQEFVKDEKLFDYTPKDQGYHSDNSWSNTDKSLETAYLILQALDYNTTRQFLRHPKNFSETNTLIGKHPSQEKLAAANLLTALSHLYIADKLPNPYKKIFQTISIGIEGNAVKNNLSLGPEVDLVRW